MGNPGEWGPSYGPILWGTHWKFLWASRVEPKALRKKRSVLRTRKCLRLEVLRTKSVLKARMAGHSGHVQSSVWHSQGYQTHSTVCLGSRKKRWWSFLCLPQLPWIFVSGGRQLVHVLGSDWMLLTTRTFYTLCKYRRNCAILPKGCATHKNLEALSECSKFEYQVWISLQVFILSSQPLQRFGRIPKGGHSQHRKPRSVRGPWFFTFRLSLGFYDWPATFFYLCFEIIMVVPGAGSIGRGHLQSGWLLPRVAVSESRKWEIQCNAGLWALSAPGFSVKSRACFPSLSRMTWFAICRLTVANVNLGSRSRETSLYLLYSLKSRGLWQNANLWQTCGKKLHATGLLARIKTEDRQRRQRRIWTPFGGRFSNGDSTPKEEACSLVRLCGDLLRQILVLFQRASERRVLLTVKVCHTFSHLTPSHLHIFTSSHFHILFLSLSPSLSLSLLFVFYPFLSFSL